MNGGRVISPAEVAAPAAVRAAGGAGDATVSRNKSPAARAGKGERAHVVASNGDRAKFGFAAGRLLCILAAMKSARDLEFLALRQLERIGRREALEPGCDAMLAWPKAALAARRLAAQANAARGNPLLWLVGIDVHGKRRPADRKGFEKWQRALRLYFDGLIPEMEALVVPAGGGKFVVAVGIETTRAPFVVRAGAKEEALEVPWHDREAGKIRSASRFDLVRMFTPLGELPHFEVLEAELTFFRNVIPRTKATYRWTLDAALYVVPRGDARIVVPLQRVRANVEILGAGFASRGVDISLTPDKGSPGVRVTESALLIENLGRVFFYCVGSTEVPELPWNEPARFVAEISPAGAELSAVIAAELRPERTNADNQLARWRR